MREGGQRRLTPNYPDPSDTKIKYARIFASLPSFRSAAAAATSGQQTSLTINKPADVEKDDLLIAAIITHSATTVTAPTGWTLIRSTSGSAFKLLVYRKLATDTEASSYTWSTSNAVTTIGGISAYIGTDTTTPIDVENGQTTASGTTHATPSVTTTVNDTMIVTHHALEANSTWTPPAGMTEDYDQTLIEASHVLQATAGATGAKTATSSATDIGITHILALKARPQLDTIATPTTGRKLRIIRIKVVQPTSDGKHFFEIYFGTSATAVLADAATDGGVIDILTVPDQGEDTTRTWARGEGPLGAKNAVLSIRHVTRTDTQHKAIIEYTEER